MSVGNTKDNGNKGNNFPWQYAVLELLGSISTNTMVVATDYELITYNYSANKNGVGYSTGDLITRTQVVSLPLGTVILTLWFNQTTGLAITAPPIADLDPVVSSTTVTVTNLPATLGQKPMANSLAVVIASDQSSIPVTNANLDAPISNLNLEATQLLIKNLLTTIDGDTSNLDVLLSTRATEATLLALSAKFNSLGQKASASSAPVVLSTEQEVILTAIKTAIENIDIDTNGLNLEATQLLIKALLTTIDADTSNLDVLLSTRSTEATQLLVKALLTTIDADTSNLDVLLSTRNAEATQLLIKAKTDNLDVLLSTRATEATLLTRLSKADFEARINTLGQKNMLNSTPVVIASDQSAIEVKGTAAVGSAPTNPPLSVSGVDIATGFKQHIPLVVVSGNQALRTTIVGISRTPSLVAVPANTVLSNTVAGKQEVSIRVTAGGNAQIGGVAVPNGTTVTYRANPGDTIGSISYQTGAGTTMLISYTT